MTTTSCWLGPANSDYIDRPGCNNFVEEAPEVRKNKRGKRWFTPVSKKTKRSRGER